MPRMFRGRILRTWEGKPLLYYRQLNFDVYTMTREELEERRQRDKEDTRIRAEERKKYHGGDK